MPGSSIEFDMKKVLIIVPFNKTVVCEGRGKADREFGGEMVWRGFVHLTKRQESEWGENLWGRRKRPEEYERDETSQTTDGSLRALRKERPERKKARIANGKREMGPEKLGVKT